MKVVKTIKYLMTLKGETNMIKLKKYIYLFGSFISLAMTLQGLDVEPPLPIDIESIELQFPTQEVEDKEESELPQVTQKTDE